MKKEVNKMTLIEISNAFIKPYLEMKNTACPPEVELNKIHNIDCLEFMKTLPDKCIDLILTDPPYGLNVKLKGGTWGINSKNREVLEWDYLIGKEYFTEMFRVSKNQIIFGGNYYTMPPSRCWIVWDKTIHGNSFADCELAWTSFNQVARIKALNIVNVDLDGRMHPTQKPVELMAWILKNYSSKSDLIYDPFAGSGTTAVACKMLGRNYILNEISPEYYKLAQDRIKSISNPLFK